MHIAYYIHFYVYKSNKLFVGIFNCFLFNLIPSSFKLNKTDFANNFINQNTIIYIESSGVTKKFGSPCKNKKC